METNYANLFSTQPLDRLEEIYLKTMNEMDDTTLQAFCSTAKYNTKLCNDNFWLRRIKDNNLELLLAYRSLYPSLQSFYFNVRKDACYILVSIDAGIEEGVDVFNDISIARLAFDNIIRETLSILSKELDYSTVESDYEIYIMFNDTILTEESILPYSLFNLRRGSENYLNPNILKYPLLSHNREVLFYTKNVGRFTTEIVIMPFDSEHLRLLPEGIWMSYVITDTVTLDNPAFFWHKNTFGIVRSEDDNVIALVDVSVLSNTSKRLLGRDIFRTNNNPEEADYRFISVNSLVYSAIVSMMGTYEREYKEPLRSVVIIETLIVNGYVGPLTGLSDFLGLL